MPIKLLTEARKGRENSSAKDDSFFRPEDGYLQLVYIIKGVMSVYLLICLSVSDSRPNGWADQDQTWHRDSR